MTAADLLADLADDLTKEAALYRRQGGPEFAAGMENAVQTIKAELAGLVPLTRAGLERKA